MITHFGLNYTTSARAGRPDAWVPIKNVPDLRAHFLQKINDHNICRCWVRLHDGIEKCVYWYEQGTLDNLEDL